VNADAFRHLYEYHFAENRRLWEAVEALDDEQLTRQVGYSAGSVRDQVLHLMWADDVWFSQLRGDEPPAPLEPAEFADRAAIRVRWDQVERRMRAYLAALRDEMLLERPFPEHPEDRDLVLWQVLLHVVNHGTDHRAQALRVASDLGVATRSQDYVFYAYRHPLTGEPSQSL
jgi:uncharacterized damage-inducible protein DinB